MKTQRIKVTVFVVLALTSLSSVAMTAPYQEGLSFLAEPLVVDVCGESSIGRFDQYMAAIEWAERGGQVPLALSVSCVEESPDLSASRADLGGDSGARWEQYMAAIEGRELSLDAAPVRTVTGNSARFEQYTAAIEWAERGGPVPLVLTVSYGEENLNITPFADHGGESWERFEQYMAAIEGREPALNATPVRTVTGSSARFEQYTAAIEWAERGGPVPLALTVSYGEENLNISPFNDLGGDSRARFEQYMAAIER